MAIVRKLGLSTIINIIKLSIDRGLHNRLWNASYILMYTTEQITDVSLFFGNKIENRFSQCNKNSIDVLRKLIATLDRL